MSTVRPVSQSPERPSGSRTGRPRKAALDEAILQAARAMLAETGFSGISMEGVAARAKVGKQALYRRWPSRGDLLIDLYYFDGMAEPEVENPDLPFASALTAFLDLNLQRLYQPWNCNLLRSLAVAAQSDATVRQAFLSRITRPRLKMGRRVLQRGILLGEVRPDLDIDMALRFAVGAIWFHGLFTDQPITKGLRNRILRELLSLVTPRNVVSAAQPEFGQSLARQDGPLKRTVSA